MPITSGVFAPRAWFDIGVAKIPVIEGEASISTKRSSSSFGGSLAVNSLPDGVLASLASTTSLDGSLIISMDGGLAGAKPIISGPVDEIEIDFTHLVMHIKGRDKSSVLHNTKNHEQYRNQSGSQIVSTIAGRHGLTPNIDSTSGMAGKQHQIDFTKLTDGESDWSLIQHLAEIEGAKCYILAGKLIFTTQQGQGSEYVVNYVPPTPQSFARGDFMHLKCARNLQIGGPIEVNVRSWHPKKKEKIESKKTLGGSGPTTIFEYRSPGLQQDQADKLATSKAKEHGRHEMTISLGMPGDVAIDPSQQLVLRGTGTEFDQSYEMDDIHHSIGGDEGYRMSIDGKSAKAGRSVS